MRPEDQSPIVADLLALLDAVGEAKAPEVLDEILSKLSKVELAALGSDWKAWARPNQLPPVGDWLVWLLLTGRGWGKTMTVARAIIGMVQSGEIREIGMAAQNEVKTYDVNVLGLIAAAPPRFVPEWNDGEKKLVFPNGAQAYAFTPEAPATIRSKNLDLAWLSEIQSWPEATRDEAYLNFKFATRVGKARTIVDCTPKKGHPLILKLLALCDKSPEQYRATRGSMRDNLAHLAPQAVAALIAEFEGTSAGLEELDGLMLTAADGALIKGPFARREASRLLRQVISVDPAVTKRSGSDLTGVIRAGLDVDHVAVVCADRTGKYSPSEWATIVIDDYVRYECDLVLVETNKGGDLLTQNLRAAASSRGIEIIVVDKTWTPRHVEGVVHVREIYSRGEKADRAKPTATAYEKGRVVHLLGADLAELETLLTTWEPKPGARSPDRMDALVGAVEELLGLSSNAIDNAKAFDGIDQISQELNRPTSQTIVTSLPSEIVALLGYGSGRGGLI